ncbi:MAG TPA: nuclear transport factor 2 family protein [Sphingomonadaceae bacterium]|nr:nuclear transport factor 2 family protein [Sphingomonadaceae bacterium]
MNNTPSEIVISAEAQEHLLASNDPVLAANKRLVYDAYRHVVIGGHAELVERYFTPGYIQHNPNVVSGRDALAGFIRGSRPARAVEPTIILPLIDIIAERDLVMLAFRREETDGTGRYFTTWFDLFRVEDGKIAEHWDPALRSPEMLKFDPNTKR